MKSLHLHASEQIYLWGLTFQEGKEMYFVSMSWRLSNMNERYKIPYVIQYALRQIRYILIYLV